jgi:hypothetical protein
MLTPQKQITLMRGSRCVKPDLGIWYTINASEEVAMTYPLRHIRSHTKVYFRKPYQGKAFRRILEGIIGNILP